jgi:hypothetical protein
MGSNIRVEISNRACRILAVCGESTITRLPGLCNDAPIISSGSAGQVTCIITSQQFLFSNKRAKITIVGEACERSGVTMNEAKRNLKIFLVLFLLIAAFGTFGFMKLEGLTFTDAL